MGVLNQTGNAWEGRESQIWGANREVARPFMEFHAMAWSAKVAEIGREGERAGRLAQPSPLGPSGYLPESHDWTVGPAHPRTPLQAQTSSSSFPRVRLRTGTMQCSIHAVSAVLDPFPRTWGRVCDPQLLK